MYSCLGRLNIYLYYTLTILSVCGLLNWASVRFGHVVGLTDFAPGEGLPEIKFEVDKFDQFIYDGYYNEDIASFSFDLDADLTTLFNWNTNIVFASLVCEYDTGNKKGFKNQITIWDKRMLRAVTEDYHLKLNKESVEYYLTDVNKSLKGNKVDVYLRWEQMATIGPYYSGMKKIGEVKLPKKYRGDR